MPSRKPIKWLNSGDQTWGITHTGEMFVIDSNDLHFFIESSIPYLTEKYNL